MEKNKMTALVEDLLNGQADAAEMIDELMEMKTFAYACGVLYAMERACTSIKSAMKANGSDPDLLIECLRRNDNTMIATMVFDADKRGETKQ